MSLLLTSCLLDGPVRPVSAPDELSYNHWFLSRCFIYPERVPSLGDSESITVSALYASLRDPYTRYVPPQQSSQQLQQDTSTVYSGGIGVEFLWSLGADSIRLQIYRVYPDGPADSAGLLVGDRLLSANGHNLQNDSAYQILHGFLTDSLWIRLNVLRNSDSLTIEIPRGVVYVPTVFTDTLDGIPVLQIRQFVRSSIRDGGSILEFQRALQATQSATVRILDLRGNPGGEIGVCLAMADEFLERGPMIHLIEHRFDGRGRAKLDTATYQAHTGGAGVGSSSILLIDSLTASCAEIFAVALHENLGNQALLVGDSTYGKGIGQSHWKTPAGGLAIITSIQVRSPQWKDYHGQGIGPDIATSPESALSTALLLAQEQIGMTRRTFLSPTLKFSRILRETSRSVAPFGGAWRNSWE